MRREGALGNLPSLGDTSSTGVLQYTRPAQVPSLLFVELVLAACFLCSEKLLNLKTKITRG